MEPGLANAIAANTTNPTLIFGDAFDMQIDSIIEISSDSKIKLKKTKYLANFAEK
jgi:hypothetical protein